MHKPCLKCSSSDGRYVYPDGSSFCFSCRSAFRGDISPYVLPPKEAKHSTLPDDCSHDFPPHIIEWVGKYDISVSELIKHNCYYSPKRNQLIYSWKDGLGETILWQARNFSPDAKSKCFTQGDVESCLPIYGKLQEGLSTFVVVEDPISAMKISRYTPSMCLLGSQVSPNKLKRLERALGPFLGHCGMVVFWLDSNMYHKAQKMANQMGLLGQKTAVVYTEEDPKACKDIQKVLDTL